MTLRNRLALAAAVAVALAVAGAALASYLAVRSKLRDEVDASLRERAALVLRLAERPRFGSGMDMPLPPPQFGGAPGYLQIVRSDGEIIVPEGEAGTRIPPGTQALQAARGQAGVELRDVSVRGTHLRVLTTPVGAGLAVQIARPLSEVDNVLHGLIVVLIVITAAGVALAVLLGRAVARAALAPVASFTTQTEQIAAHPDQGRRLEVEGRDELARLGTSFNQTLDALESSLAAQRNLVADASHELRTPLTSVRTNVEVLTRSERLDPEDRDRLVADIVEQIDELTALVADVVELARGAAPASEVADMRLDEVVAGSVERALRNSPDVSFRVELEPTTIEGDAKRLDRAVTNLLDNAAKWSPPGAEVEVRLAGGELTVRDHGPGFDPKDLPHVFDRFYRADDARSMPGSGLGLAIVRQVAESHGGSVSARNADGGGAEMLLRLPAGEAVTPPERAAGDPAAPRSPAPGPAG